MGASFLKDIIDNKSCQKLYERLLGRIMVSKTSVSFDEIKAELMKDEEFNGI